MLARHNPNFLSIPLVDQVRLTTRAFWILIGNTSAVIIKELHRMGHHFLVYKLTSWVEDTDVIDLSLNFCLESISEVVVLHRMAMCLQKLNNFAQIYMLGHLRHEILLSNYEESFEVHLFFVALLIGITITVALIVLVFFFKTIYFLLYLEQPLDCVHPEFLVLLLRQPGSIFVADFDDLLDETIESLHGLARA